MAAQHISFPSDEPGKEEPSHEQIQAALELLGRAQAKNNATLRGSFREILDKDVTKAGAKGLIFELGRLVAMTVWQHATGIR